VLPGRDLVGPNLTNLVRLLPADRYSYSFDGNAQVLDHALVTRRMLPWVTRFTYAHLNADYPEILRNDPNRPERLSDHDASVTYLGMGIPSLAGSVVAQTSQIDGRIDVTVRLTNTGSGHALGVVLKDLVATTASGREAEIDATVLPMALGDIAAGQSTAVTITLMVPPGVTRLSIAEEGAFLDASGVRYPLSLDQQVIVRSRY
jgi:hypothetical protein